MVPATYWPWWLGAASLAVVTVGCCVVARRPLGVSGIVARFVNLRDELRVERLRSARVASEAEVEAALLAATAEAFGTMPAGGVAEPVAPGEASAALESAGKRRERCGGDCASPAARPTLGAHAVFLAGIVAGGLLVQLSRGAWRPTIEMGATFARIYGTAGRGALALGLGGVLVGIGTTISGGCSTGHGLSGCSRLQPAGVAATLSFMASAIAVSFLLERRFF